MFFILDRHDKPVPVAGALAWSYWRDRHPEKIQIERTKLGTTLISTVFLGLDHSHFLQGPPMLFETMIFNDEKHEGYQTRCSTIVEARAMHADAIRHVQTIEGEVIDGTKL